MFKSFSPSSKKVLAVAYIFFVVTIMLASVIGEPGLFSNNNFPNRQANPTDPVSGLQSGTGIFEITFSETGLNNSNSNGYYGAEWAVHLVGTSYDLIKHSSSRLITFNVSAGSYTYAVIKEFGYGVTPETGSISVSNANVQVIVTFVPKLFYVTFVESGLPSSSSAGSYPSEWNVNLSGVVKYSNSSTITYLEQNGSYSYSISSSGSYVPSPASSKVVVNGSDQNVPVVFTKNLLQVTFYESGLPLSPIGIEWSVTIKNSSHNINLTENSFASSLVMTVPNGLYSYSVTSPSTYYASPAQGRVNVSSENYFIPISFHRSLFLVTFEESGLPQNGSSPGSAPSVWSVVITNDTSGQSMSVLNQGVNLSVSLKDGTYAYRIVPVSGFTSTPSYGTLTVDNAYYLIKVIFKSTLVHMVFKEKGLFNNTLQNPGFGSYGTYWQVKLVNTTSSSYMVEGSDSSNITFWAQPGTYSYTVAAVSGFTIGANASGSLSVPAGYKQVNVSFVLSAPLAPQAGGKTINITFSEHGLIAGTVWSVALSNSSKNSTEASLYTGNITFTVPNGTYYYRMLDVGYMHPAVASGVFAGTGKLSYNIPVYFENVSSNLVVSQTGLPSLQPWSITIKNANNRTQQFTVPYGLLSIPLENGTYYYHVETSGTFASLNNLSGSFVINGTEVGLNLSFSTFYHAVKINEFGLSRGTTWSFAILGENGTSISYTSNFGTFSANLPNGTYLLRFVQSGNMTPFPSSVYFVVTGSSVLVENVTFTQDLEQVSFIENGLPLGTSWSVTLGGMTQVSTLGAITFTVPQGTYDYRILSVGNMMPSPYSSAVFVSTFAQTINVAFHSQVFPVEIHESGLPNGTTWSISLNDQTLTSSGATITTYLPNGSYFYSFVGQGYYIPLQPDGFVNVSASSVTINVEFEAFLFDATFAETGLPANTTWTFSLYGFNGITETITTNNTSYTLLVPNGTYVYQVQMVDQYIPLPSVSSVKVAGSEISVQIVFKIYRYLLTFNENNLPAGTLWHVNLTSGTGQKFSNSSTGNQITFNLTNETYSYTFSSANKTWANETVGSVTINGAPVSITANFTELRYKVSIEETGLNKNTNWGITLDGSTYSTNNTSIVVLLTNGTYTFTVNSVGGYNETPSSGKIIVSGSSLTTRVSYTLIVHIINGTQPKTGQYNTFIVLGTLVGIGVIGLGIITVLYYQRKKT